MRRAGQASEPAAVVARGRRALLGGALTLALASLPSPLTAQPQLGVVHGEVVQSQGRRLVVRGLPAGAERVAFVRLDHGVSSLAAVGRVIGDADGREGDTEVEIGRGEVVRVASHAVVTELAETADPWAPPRHGNVWQANVALRGMLAIDPGASFGGGPSTSLRYRAGAPLVITAELFPFVLVPRSTASGDVGVAVVWGGIGLDLPMFEITVGAGASVDAHDRFATWVFALVQRVRFGAIDGLNLELTFVEGLTNPSGPLLHSMVGRLEVPLEALGLDRGLWLLARGAGGAAGYGLGELGLRVGGLGNGWRGTIDLVFFAGLMGVYDQATNVHLGPTLGVELETRF